MMMVEVTCTACGFTWDIEPAEAAMETCAYCPKCQWLVPLN